MCVSVYVCARVHGIRKCDVSTMRVQIHRLYSVSTDFLLTEKKSITSFCSVLIDRSQAHDSTRRKKRKEGKRERGGERERDREDQNLLFCTTQA